jgi:uncharacterized protein (DUF1330 family)
MPAFMIVDIDIHDAPGFAEYGKQVPALVAKHGGKYLARGGTTEVMEGDWNPKRLGILQFPDTESIRAFLNDPEYLPIKAIRQRTAKTNAVAVEGV